MEEGGAIRRCCLCALPLASFPTPSLAAEYCEFKFFILTDPLSISVTDTLVRAYAQSILPSFWQFFFPGAVVAFNYASIQALPAVASLRIYCAGIWHNVVFCAVYTLVLFLLPYILSSFYPYGEHVMDGALSSPLSGNLSPRDVIVYLDDSHIHTTEEWKRMIMLLTEQNKLLSLGQEIVEGHKGLDTLLGGLTGVSLWHFISATHGYKKPRHGVPVLERGEWSARHC